MARHLLIFRLMPAPFEWADATKGQEGRTMRISRLRGLMLTLAGAGVLTVTTALAATSPDQKCQQGRYDASAKYAACHQEALGKLLAGGDSAKFEVAASKCRIKYTDTWAKLQTKASGTGVTCDNDRYDDNGDGTVTDRLTGLQWEMTTDDNTLLDKDNTYSWSTTDGDDTDADGTVFTTFLPALNSGDCFAGQCDWRLPTIAELQTILLEPYPCATSPCIDQSVFGPTVADYYWSATTYANFPSFAWLANFLGGFVGDSDKDVGRPVRAVRAGL